MSQVRKLSGKFLNFQRWKTLGCCENPFQIKISSMNQTVDPPELCKETMFQGIISTFLCVILWLLFAFVGISNHRKLFYRKTENARSCFTCRSVSRIMFLHTELLILRNYEKTWRIIYSESFPQTSG